MSASPFESLPLRLVALLDALYPLGWQSGPRPPRNPLVRLIASHSQLRERTDADIPEHPAVVLLKQQRERVKVLRALTQFAAMQQRITVTALLTGDAQRRKLVLRAEKERRAKVRKAHHPARLRSA